MDQAQKDEAIRKTEEYIQHLKDSEKTESDGETKKDIGVAIKYTKEGLSVLQGRRRLQQGSLEDKAKDWVEAVKEEVKTMDQAQKDEAIRKTEEYIQHLEDSEKTETDGETKKDIGVAIKYTKEGLSVLQGRRRLQQGSLEDKAMDWLDAVKEEVKTMDQSQKDEAITKTEEYIQHLKESEKTETDGETKKGLGVAIKYTEEGLSVLQGRRRIMSEQASLVPIHAIKEQVNSMSQAQKDEVIARTEEYIQQLEESEKNETDDMAKKGLGVAIEYIKEVLSVLK